MEGRTINFLFQLLINDRMVLNVHPGKDSFGFSSLLVPLSFPAVSILRPLVSPANRTNYVDAEALNLIWSLY